jgi:hypothetical protein
VVVPDLRDDIRGAVPRNHPAVDDELLHGAMVLAKPNGGRHGTHERTHQDACSSVTSKSTVRACSTNS